MQGESAVSYDNRMAGIGAAVVTDDDIAVLGQNINNLAFALIAPLQSYNTTIHFHSLSGNPFYNPNPKDKPQQLMDAAYCG
jgi:hypothetical protein